MAAPILHQEIEVGHWRKDLLEGHDQFRFNFFAAKDNCAINFTLFLPLFAFETAWEVFLFQTAGHVIVILYFVSLAAWWSFRHLKLTAGGEVRARILAIEFGCFFSFFLFFFFVPTSSIFFTIKRTHSRSKRRGKAERRRRTVRFTRFVDYRLMFDSGRSFTLEYNLIRSPY